MPVFTYRATNDDNKEIHGSLDAPTIDAARRSLEDQHLDILELSESMRVRSPDAKPSASAGPQPVTFAYEGSEAGGKIRRGTIQAQTKREAYEHLRMDQKLILSALWAMGSSPSFRDPDLENWQKSDTPAPSPPPPPPLAPKKTSPETIKPKQISFTMPAGTLAPAPAPQQTPAPRPTGTYHPLLTTLRLYAGWLLAWYALFVTVGYYAHVRSLPWDIPFVEAFFISPLIFSFTVSIFLFLLLTSIHRAIHGRAISALLLTACGIGTFFFVRASVV